MNSQLMRGVPKDEMEGASPRIKTLLADPAMDYIRRAVKLQAKKITAADYDQPSWAYKQAHQNGYNQAIEDVLKLLT